MREASRASVVEVTQRVSVDLTVPTIQVPDLDAMIRAGRASADRFLRRDCPTIARLAGLDPHVVQQLRSERDDLLPAHVKVALVTFGGRAMGRTFEETSDFLGEIHAAAGIEPNPVTEVVGTIGVEKAGAAVLREAHELIAALLERIKDGIDASELPIIEKEANDLRTAAARVIREAQAAVVPVRGRKFQK